MAYNGSGTFTRTNGDNTGATTWAQDRDEAVKITAARHDTHDQDVATGLSTAICKDGQTTITSNIPFNGKKITGLGNGTTATDAMNRQTGDARWLQLGAANTMATGGYIALDDSVTSAATVPLPLCFDNDTNTGAVRTGPNAWSLVCDATAVLNLATTGVTIPGTFDVLGAAVFSGQVTLGNAVGDSVTLTGHLTANVGTSIKLDNSVSNPAVAPLPLCFDGDTDCGIIHTAAANTWSLVAGAVAVINLVAAGVTIPGTLTVNSVSQLNGNVGLGGLVTDAITLNGKMTLNAGTCIKLDDSVTAIATDPLPLCFDTDTRTGMIRTAPNAFSLVCNATAVINLAAAGITIPGTLAVTGASTFTGAATFNGGVTTLTVTGAAVFNGAVTLGDAAGDAITVTGTATFAQTATFNGAAVFNGNVDIGSDQTDVITIDGQCWFSQNLVVSSAQMSGFTTSDDNTPAVGVTATHASYVGTLMTLNTNKAEATDFYFLTATGDVDGTPDTLFAVRGNGQVYSEFGSAMSTPADYAEAMEWADGNPSNLDRRGYCVVLVGGKIRIAEASDSTDDIIGVVSGDPAVLGDSAWNRWAGMYERDPFGMAIREKYNGADGVMVERRKLSKHFEKDKPYIPRMDRPEWCAVGAVGKLAIRKGQPVHPRWRKLSDLSPTTERWWVR